MKIQSSGPLRARNGELSLHGALGQSGIATLSEREREVVRLASDGYTDHSICRELGISPGTLGTYWARVRSKTGLTSRTELAAAFARHNFERVLIGTVGMIAERSVPYGASGSLSINPGIVTDIFELLPIAVIVSDDQGHVVSMNAMAASLLETRAIPGGDLMAMVSPDDSMSVAEAFLESRCSFEPFQFEATIRAKNGPKKFHWYARKLSENSSFYLLVLSESLRDTRATARSRSVRPTSAS